MISSIYASQNNSIQNTFPLTFLTIIKTKGFKIALNKHFYICVTINVDSLCEYILLLKPKQQAFLLRFSVHVFELHINPWTA